jgi:hypothetical protein
MKQVSLECPNVSRLGLGMMGTSAFYAGAGRPDHGVEPPPANCSVHGKLRERASFAFALLSAAVLIDITGDEAIGNCKGLVTLRWMRR